VHLVVGHSHSFDAPILRARALIAGGDFGAVRMINTLNYTDFVYRPRRPEELDTAQGGGAIFSQGAHQVDIVRLLGGGEVKSVRAGTGAFDAARPTEGAYSALLTFRSGAFASLTYGGYGHFDSDEFLGWIGEMGQAKTPYARTPQRFASPEAEAAAKSARNYGGANYQPAANAPLAHQNFGLLIASCERAELRPLPNGVMDLSERHCAPRSVAAPGRAARRSDRRALRTRWSGASRRCTTALGPWRRSKSVWRSCVPRARACEIALDHQVSVR
jgi:phthalate 4,5-cis-dihydrodiol dehydrogenase